MWGNIYIFIRFYEKSPVSKETELLKRILLKDSQSPNDSYLDSYTRKGNHSLQDHFPSHSFRHSTSHYHDHQLNKCKTLTHNTFLPRIPQK